MDVRLVLASGPARAILVLGALLGSDAFVHLGLSRKRETQDQLLTRLPAVGARGSSASSAPSRVQTTCFECSHLARRRFCSRA